MGKRQRVIDKQSFLVTQVKKSLDLGSIPRTEVCPFILSSSFESPKTLSVCCGCTYNPV